VQVGDIVDGRYRLLDVLGEGAAGKVFRCEDLGRGNMFVALKMLHAKDPRWENFFRKEFEILSRLHHPNLVRVFDFGPAPDDGSWYFTQELVVGKPLLDSLAGKKIDEVLALFVEICRALEFIHGHGVLHRDLKPANILVQSHAEPGERVRVLDFGLWRELDPTPQRGARWAGTPPYLASEVLRGFGHSICADLYAVGVTLFQVITRKLPHGRGTPQELLAARKTPAPSLADLGYGSRALSDVLVRLLDEEPSRRPQSAAEVAAALSQLIPNQAIAMPIALGRARLVGRDNEQKRIADLCDLVKERRPEAPRLVIVEGKDGVGKSRFVAELKASEQLNGSRAAIGTCLEDGRWAYRPIADWVRALAPLGRRAQLTGSERMVIDRLCPEFVEKGEKSTDDAPRNKAERERFQAAAAQLFLNMGAPSVAVVLVVEDIGFCDAASAAVIAQLVKHAKQHGVVVVATFDPTRVDDALGLGAFPSEVLEAAGREVVRLPLEGLRRDDVRKLVAALLGVPTPDLVPEAFAELLLSHSGGNPLLVEEVLALMIQRGDLKRGEIGWQLDEYRQAVVNTPTATVVEQRLLRLGDVDRRTLRALAVFNRPAGPKLLAAVARLDVDQVRRALATAEAQGLIRVVDTEDGRPRVVFRHPNIREALIKGLKDDGTLASWHEVCAAVLEERALKSGNGNLAPVAETLAVHLERAGDFRRAVGFFVLGVDHALATFAFDDALMTARRAARLAQSANAGIALADVVRVDVAVGKALFLCGQIREARAFIESALERDGVNTTQSYGELHVWLARACLRLGNNEIGLAHVEKALAGLGSDVLARARLFIARAELLQLTNPTMAEKDAERAIVLLGKKPSLDDELAALAVKGNAAFAAGHFTIAAEVATRRFELCKKSERKLEEVSALRGLADAEAALGDRLGAREHLNAALKLAQGSGHRVEEALLLQALGDQLLISGAYSEAIGRYQNAATLAAETGQTLCRAACLRQIGKSYLGKGDYERAIDHLKSAVDAYDRAGTDDDSASSRAALVLALLTRPASVAEAEAVLAVARSRLKKTALPRAIGDVGVAEGQYYMQKGSFVESRLGFTRAIAAFRKVNDRFHLGDALVGLAQLLLRSQAPRRALRLARRAEWTFTDLDARGQLKRIQPLLNATSGLSKKS
jgi:tetratricopeptide (TPR) repeat protein